MATKIFQYRLKISARYLLPPTHYLVSMAAMAECAVEEGEVYSGK
ncbi:hypothetical protein SPONN_2360 [uncultured Candidatus Thioglobus sp.]|nr:hypothetical protein SPONL_1156 [uncultured Candidatus Thioglobus sp.]SMN01287.1 hypothetical protein SPONN_2360 [uncultured Candidatus Thioglobus sp.]